MYQVYSMPHVSTTIVPFQTWPAQAGTAIGILCAPCEHWELIIWGHLFVGLNSDARNGEKYFYWQSGPSMASLQAPYFSAECTNSGLNPIRAWQVPTPAGYRPFDVAALGPAVPNTHGLTEPAHLVRVEVNGGEGSPQGNLHFVITKCEIIDGGTLYPALVGLREKFDEIVQQNIQPFPEGKVCPPPF